MICESGSLDFRELEVTRRNSKGDEMKTQPGTEEHPGRGVEVEEVKKEAEN